VTVVVCFLLVLAGFPLVLAAFRSWAPNVVVDAVSSLSFLATVLIINMKKAD